jgi:ATP-dependent DNA helicase DinG
LIAGEESTRDLRQALAASGALASEGWLSRVKQGFGHGAGEEFLAHVHRHVLARSTSQASPYAIEAELHPLSAELRDAARELDRALARLAVPLTRLAGHLRHRLDAEAAKLETVLRGRIEAAARGLERRSQLMIPAWRDMLGGLEEDAAENPQFASWFEIRRDEGRDSDIGMHRSWIDPTIPFAETVLKNAHGVLITSATLRDTADALPESGWRSAEVRVGAHHLPEPPRRAVFDSPFDWPKQARVLVVRDLVRGDRAQLAAAYRELFLCAGGGALGLFTAVGTLKDVHARIAEPLSAAGLMLFAQHVDALDTGTLVDLFRADENACVLGTDALRDGIDVPGRSLRLCVFDKVPWPKPSILHKARRARFGKDYDDLIARLRLKQAFGRLIRSETDRGVFVILDGACPSRLLAGLPPQIPAIRCGLKEAIEETRGFLSAGMQPP